MSIQWIEVAGDTPAPLDEERILIHCSTGDMFTVRSLSGEWLHRGGDEVWWAYVTHWAKAPTLDSLCGILTVERKPEARPNHLWVTNILLWVDGQWEDGRYDPKKIEYPEFPERWWCGSRTFEADEITRWAEITPPIL
jgi:hypothetical protein